MVTEAARLVNRLMQVSVLFSMPSRGAWHPRVLLQWMLMPRVIFHDVDGQRIEANVSAGNTVMEAALDNGVAGILAECGGACACATCHAYVAEAWLPRLRPLEDMEDAMLDTAVERRPTSRLMCQIELTPELDGLEVFVARNES